MFVDLCGTADRPQCMAQCMPLPLPLTLSCVIPGLRDIFEQQAGAVVLFTWIEWLKEELKLLPIHHSTLEEGEGDDNGEAEEDGASTSASASTGAGGAVGVMDEAARRQAAQDFLGGIEVVHGEPYTERKVQGLIDGWRDGWMGIGGTIHIHRVSISPPLLLCRVGGWDCTQTRTQSTFQAHVGKIKTEAEAHRVVEYLLMNGRDTRTPVVVRSLLHIECFSLSDSSSSDRMLVPPPPPNKGKIARATHNMWAFRVWDEGKNAQVNGTLIYCTAEALGVGKRGARERGGSAHPPNPQPKFTAPIIDRQIATTTGRTRRAGSLRSCWPSCASTVRRFK